MYQIILFVLVFVVLYLLLKYKKLSIESVQNVERVLSYLNVLLSDGENWCVCSE